ncbi:STN domain-containing protein [Parabacteroides sp.]
MEDILSEIENQTDYLFVSNRDVDLKQKVSVRVKDQSVETVLDEVLKNTGVTFTVEGVNIVLSPSMVGTILQQNKKRYQGRLLIEMVNL